MNYYFERPPNSERSLGRARAKLLVRTNEEMEAAIMEQFLKQFEDIERPDTTLGKKSACLSDTGPFLNFIKWPFFSIKWPKRCYDYEGCSLGVPEIIRKCLLSITRVS